MFRSHLLRAFAQRQKEDAHTWTARTQDLASAADEAVITYEPLGSEKHYGVQDKLRFFRNDVFDSTRESASFRLHPKNTTDRNTRKGRTTGSSHAEGVLWVVDCLHFCDSLKSDLGNVAMALL